MEPKFTRWIRQVRDTEDVEIDCSACLDQISPYVDIELAGGAAAREMPQVAQHVAQCKVCHEEYKLLRELARLENDRAMPSLEELRQQLGRRQ